MQYFKPFEVNLFVGDCMPFFHDGIFHLFYLLDEDHHRGNNGLGGHQWAHSSSADLVHWQHHPLAIPLGSPGAYDSASICTGSVIYHDSMFYAFYSTRWLDDGHKHQAVCLATSTDGITFTKHEDNPLIYPGAVYCRQNFRDPFVFRGDDGRFHMLVTASLCEAPAADRAGCLAHLVSSDLLQWEDCGPFIDGLYGRTDSFHAPECSDYFRWNDWYYLLYGDTSTGYTRYLLSRTPFGPWESPEVDTFDTSLAAVMKTAPFRENRRIGVAFARSRSEQHDDADLAFGGNALFRELVQHDDGTLGCCWPREMLLPSHSALELTMTPLTAGVSERQQDCAVRLNGGETLAMYAGVPVNAYISVQIDPDAAAFGLRLRGVDSDEDGYELRFLPDQQQVVLQRATVPSNPRESTLTHVTGLNQPFSLNIIMKDDIIDVCIDDRRCLCQRLPELRGDKLFLFTEEGQVDFRSLQIRPLINPGQIPYKRTIYRNGSCTLK